MFYNQGGQFSTSQSYASVLIDKLHEIYSPDYFVNDVFPLEKEDLLSVHSKDYIDSFLCSKERFEYLPTLLRGGAVTSSILYSFEKNSSSMVPASGFHHARYGGAGTFCLFNSPMVGLNLLVNNYGVKKIGYIDLDAHFADGTYDIIRKLNLEKNFVTYDFTTEGFAPGQKQEDYQPWLDSLYNKLENHFSDCDFIYLYHGYDAHIDDPLGGYLDDHNIKKRDRALFSFLKHLGAPYSWCLGGAYFDVENVHKLQLYGITQWLDKL